MSKWYDSYFMQYFVVLQSQVCIECLLMTNDVNKYFVCTLCVWMQFVPTELYVWIQFGKQSIYHIHK